MTYVTEVAAVITLLGTLIGSLLALAYQAGKLSVRVDHLETWRVELREELRKDFDNLTEGQLRLEQLMREEPR